VDDKPKRPGLATLAQLQNQLTPNVAVPPADTPNVETTKSDRSEPNEPVENLSQATQLDTAQALAAQLLENERTMLAQKQADALKEATAPNVVVFLTKYPSLTMYVPIRGHQRRLDFQHGVLRVTDPDVMEAIRANKRFKTGMIKEAGKTETVAMREAIDRRRVAMMAATQGGMDTSTFGSEAAFMAQSGQLDSAELRLMDDM
jgi:hypothetical protein